jgi:hypothetical protein
MRWVRLVAAALALVGCATGPFEGVAPVAPEPKVAPETWAQVEADIVRASVVARCDAAAQARAGLRQWMVRVRRHTDETFIPWYTGYWTQEWLAVKGALHRTDQAGDDVAPTPELVAYLQEQFATQVLEPAAVGGDPRAILREATARYLHALSEKTGEIGERYALPQPAFRARLAQLPAIAAAVPAPGASLGDLVLADDWYAVPGYAALLARLEGGGLIADARPGEGRLSPIASAIAEGCVPKLARRGGAAAAAIAGGPVGLAISLGITGWSVIDHNRHKPALEVQLRAVLDPAFDEMEHALLEDPEHGVLAAVNHIHGEMERALWGVPTNTESPLPEFLW